MKQSMLKREIKRSLNYHINKISSIGDYAIERISLNCYPAGVPFLLIMFIDNI